MQPDTWRRRYEEQLTVAFAMAVYSRLPRTPGTQPTRRHGQPADPASIDPTFPLPDPGPPRPPPPPDSFRPRGPTEH
jgi:hypothetical protein